jgi:hypothetical protein
MGPGGGIGGWFGPPDGYCCSNGNGTCWYPTGYGPDWLPGGG